MKPKHHRFLRHLPATICIAASLPFTAQADLINTANILGNVTVDGTQNGANTIIAQGGTNPFVKILSSADLSGDGEESAVLSIEASDYDISVDAGGRLVGSDHQGIYSTEVFTLSNSGTISGGGVVNEGIESVGGLTSITNYGTGTISGTDDAIYFNSDGGTIVNHGLINGITGTESDGIDGEDGVSITNRWGGSIQGNDKGVNVWDTLNLTNHFGGTITGANGAGVSALDDATIDNSGRISGGNHGILAGNGGLITTNITNNGYIIGSDGDGVRAGNSFVIVNNANGVITGIGEDSAGVSLSDHASVTNHGTISGTAVGIEVGDDSLVTNSGTVSGLIGIDAFSNFNTKFSLNNSGDIWGLGGVAIDGGNGADILNLNPGSLVMGDILLRDAWGEDDLDVQNVVSMTSFNGEDSSSVVVGDIVGGEDTDILNMSGGLTEILNFNGDVDFEDYLESASNSDLNIVLGNVSDMEQINKIGTGVAVITGFQEGAVLDRFNDDVNVEVDQINITGGGLYINGAVYGDSSDYTKIRVGGENETELGGTGEWDAHIMLGEDAGLSAGQIAINLDWNLEESTMYAIAIEAAASELSLSTTTLLATPPIPSSPLVVDPIGTLDVYGSITLQENAFIRYDLKPQLDTKYWIEGDDKADLILHSSDLYEDPNTASVNAIVQPLLGHVEFEEGSKIRLSPTSLGSAVSDGTYVIVDSDVDIIGMPDSLVSVQFNGNIPDTGDFRGSLVPDLVGTQTANVYGTNLARFTELSKVNNGVLGEDGQSLIATIEHDYQGLPGLSDNESNLGAALDASVNSPNPLIQDFVTALDYSDLVSTQNTLSSLIPDAMIGQTTALVSSNYRIHRLAQDHLAQTRSSGVVIETPASTDAKGVVTPAQTSTAGCGNANVWGTFSYDWKDSSGDNNADFDGEDASFTAGIDYRISADWLLGIMLDGSKGDYDYDGGGSDVDSYRVAVYGTYGSSTGLYSDFLLGYGDHDLDTNRGLGGILSGTGADSDTDAASLQAMLTVGYAMECDNIKHGPWAGLEYQNVNVDDYTQKGLLPIDVEMDDVDSFRFLIGYRAQATYGQLTPYASVAYAHEFEDDNITGTGTIPGGAEFDFDSNGLDSAILISVGAGFAFSECLSMNVGYHGEISTGDGVDSNGGSIGLNYSF